eukprot:gnl/TRDRNA2_/TRDRNA2_138346_c1_seq1.p1 gnl/TRDRNA2_/TRDRNA2_138346_c1~~gnl/TRDRNA2_/TRDRNA2_138346_c1_seq1.p1  ORF type:complete len:159 (+),score=36.82 gnl/TRDRNA2_/TRDRNA2_138346_c1_seq1:85-561(+)
MHDAMKAVCCEPGCEELRSDAAVQHALQVRAAVQSHKYTEITKLAQEKHNLNYVFVDEILDKVRFRALKTMVAAYMPDISIDAIATMLGFDDDETPKEDVVNECAYWVLACNATVSEGRLLCRQSDGRLVLPDLTEEVTRADGQALRADAFFSSSLMK